MIATQPSGRHCVFREMTKQISRYLRASCITEGVVEWLVGRRVRRRAGASKHTHRGVDLLGRGYLVDPTTETNLDHKEKWYRSMRWMLKNLTMVEDKKETSELENLANKKTWNASEISVLLIPYETFVASHSLISPWISCRNILNWLLMQETSDWTRQHHRYRGGLFSVHKLLCSKMSLKLSSIDPTRDQW